MTGTELLVVFMAVSAGAMVKGITGIGLPLTAVPIMSLVLGVEDAVVVIAVPNLGSNAALVYTHRSVRHESEGLATFVVVGGLTAVGGAWLLTSVDERWLLLALAFVVSIFLAWRLASADPTWSPAVRRIGRVPVAALAGLGQGAIGISGPVVAPWFQGHGFRREVFVFSNSFVFLATGIAQIVGLLANDVWTSARLGGAIVAAVAVAVVQPVGAKVGRGLDQRGFERAVTAVLLVAAVSLVVRAL